MRCPSCGGELPAWSRFCSWCGAPAPEGAWGGPEGGEIAAWRRDGGAWILLHVAIGLLGIWAIQLLLLGLALLAADAPLAVLPVHIVPAAGGLAGWFLFVYLRGDVATRLAALLGPVLLGMAATLALTLRG